MTTEHNPNQRSDWILDATTPATSLDELRRAEILVHTRYPDPGPWYPLGMATYAGLITVAIAIPDPYSIILSAACICGAGIAAMTYQKRRGTNPRLAPQPDRLRREMAIFLTGAGAIILALVALSSVAPLWVVAPTAALLAGVGTAVYQRRYANAAHQVEVDAGIEPLASV